MAKQTITHSFIEWNTIVVKNKLLISRTLQLGWISISTRQNLHDSIYIMSGNRTDEEEPINSWQRLCIVWEKGWIAKIRGSMEEIFVVME